nr:MAG TPA: chromosome partitioning protein [Caudoviricetes sp.]
MIDAVIKTGDTLTLQLIENIQRNDLTAAEREQGVAEMLATGISQQEISSKLAKTEQWVSKHLAAHRVRVLLQQQNIDTEQYETTTLNVFRTVPESDLKPLIEKTAALGGTRAAAEAVIRTYKNSTTQPAQSEPTAHSHTDRSTEPAMTTPPVNPTTADTVDKKHTPTASSSSIPVSAAREKNEPAQSFSQAASKQIHSHSETKSNNIAANEEKIPVADKLISSKFVFAEITAYIKAIENTIKTLDSDSAKLLEQAKIEAAYDIIALLHTDTEI